MNNQNIFYRIFIPVFLIVFFITFTIFNNQPTQGDNGIAQKQPSTPTYHEGKALLEYEANTIDVFDRSAKSVVYIQSKAVGVANSFFSRRIVERPRGSGTGFMWDDQGHIVTNFHVILDANKFIVTLADQSTYDAEVVGLEPNKDLAVLKIKAEPKKLHPIKKGSSKSLRVGRKVLAIGNPFGLDQTLTVGVVSALGREIQSLTKRTIHGVIQTDAAINPGNSGGPLINSSGELIGVNTMIFSETGSNVGIGFAVPVDTVKIVVPQLIKYGKVIRPGLGIRIMPDADAKRRGFKGVVIVSVEKNGVAHKAGLQGFWRDQYGRIYIGDIITGIDHNNINNADELAHVLESYKIGDEVTVRFIRKNQKKSATIKLQRLD